MKITIISIRTRPPHMGTTQFARDQHSRQGAEIEVMVKYGIYSITEPIHGTIATGDKETSTRESRRSNRELEGLKISTPRPRHLTPAQKTGEKPHRGETPATII
jgi:hypothetical protein